MTNNMKKYKRPVVREIKADMEELLTGSDEMFYVGWETPKTMDAGDYVEEHGHETPFAKGGCWVDEWE